MKAQRDEFIEELFVIAKSDPSIVFISVDMGAPALDQWRLELPTQFIAAGISEQNAINLAAGLSAAGKKPYVYMMACWVARCFEQIRYSCAMGDNPITILGNGVALGYAPAGPAHEATEDLAYMRAIEGLEIVSPSTNHLVRLLVSETVNNPKLRYIRLERSVSEKVNLSESPDDGFMYLDTGLNLILKRSTETEKTKITIVTSGYLLDRALNVADILNNNEHMYSVNVMDLWRIKPINSKFFHNQIKEEQLIITIEEQALSAAFGSAVLECLSDLLSKIPVLRLGLDNAFIFENGTRDQLLDTHGLSIKNIEEKILKFTISRVGLNH
jgi:transketolase